MDDFKKYMTSFFNSYNGDGKSRYHAYDHCKMCFNDNRDNPSEEQLDLMALHLFAYLASWGMLRNSFLLQKDYKFLVPIVKLLCDKEYAELYNFNPFDADAEKHIDTIIALIKRLRKICTDDFYISDKTGEEVRINEPTDTLVTKILLGTLGCVPAYDDYLKAALKDKGFCQTCNPRSIEELIGFAREHKTEICSVNGLTQDLYPPFKIIDIYLWEYGLRLQ